MTATNDKQIHTARCLCGAITLEARGGVSNTAICHCDMCKRASSAAFVHWITFRAEDFAVIKGELAFYRSGEKSKRGHCRDCGSSLTFHFPGTVDIAIGCMDRPADYPGTKHIWTTRQVRHVNIVDDLPRFEKE